MITSFRRLFLAVLIGSGFLFSGTIVMPQAAVAQEQVTPKKKTNKKTSKKKTNKKTSKKKNKKEQSAAQKG